MKFAIDMDDTLVALSTFRKPTFADTVCELLETALEDRTLTPQLAMDAISVLIKDIT